MSDEPSPAGGADVDRSGSVPAHRERLALVRVSALAVGVVAIGSNARGVVAVGINAVGVVAVGINAVGAVVALGGNCIAPISVSLVNGLGIGVFSALIAVGAVGHGLTVTLINPWLAVPLLISSIAAGRRWPGRWRSGGHAEPTVPLVELTARAGVARWARVRLLSTGKDHIVVGDADGQLTLRASGDLLEAAAKLGARRRARLLVQVEVEREAALDEPGAYRVSAAGSAVARLVGLRELPRSIRWPTDGAELTWLLSRAAVASSLVTALVCLVVTLLG